MAREEITMEKNEFKPLPPGRYVVKVGAYEQKIGKSDPNSKYFKWTLNVNGEDGFNGRIIWMNTMYSGSKTWFLKKFVAAIDPSYDFQETESEDGKIKWSIDPDDLIGQKVEIEIDYDLDKFTGQPSKYPTVKEVFPYVSDIADFNKF